MPRLALAPGQLLMMTIRSHDQYNTTIYGLDDRYRGIRGGRRVVFVNEDDLAGAGAGAGHDRRSAPAATATRRASRDRFRVVPYPIPRGCAAAYFPEANALVPLSRFAPGSRTPASKSIVIEVTPSG